MVPDLFRSYFGDASRELEKFVHGIYGHRVFEGKIKYRTIAIEMEWKFLFSAIPSDSNDL